MTEQVEHYDVVVLGGGSGGVAGGRRAAGHGAKVAIIEGSRLGGTCVHRGCVPKKLMRSAALFRRDSKIAQKYGWKFSEPTFHWDYFRKSLSAELTRLEKIYEGLAERSGVEVIQGWGRFTGPKQITVGDRVIEGDKIVIAVGGKPFVPSSIIGSEHAWTSDDIFELEEIPDSMVVMGSGYIGVEMASILSGLGVDVVLSFRSGLVLPGFDQELRERLQQELEQAGVMIKTGITVQELRPSEKGVTVITDAGTWDFGGVLMATGRTPRLEGIGLEKLGLSPNEKGFLEVDEYLQTGAEGVYALGDCVGMIPLTPVAIREGRSWADYHFGGLEHYHHYDNVPTAVFTIPGVGVVGETEEEVVSNGDYGLVDVYINEFVSMHHKFGGSTSKTFFKMLVERKSGKIIGFHLLGDGATELIQLLGVGVQQGLSLDAFKETVAVHPTIAEELVLWGEPVRTVNTERKG